MWMLFYEWIVVKEPQRRPTWGQDVAGCAVNESSSLPPSTTEKAPPDSFLGQDQGSKPDWHSMPHQQVLYSHAVFDSCFYATC